MSGFIEGDRAAHYAYGAIRSITAGEWDRQLPAISRAIAERLVKIAELDAPPAEPFAREPLLEWPSGLPRRG